MLGLLLFFMITFSFVYNIRDIYLKRKRKKAKITETILRSEDI